MMNEQLREMNAALIVSSIQQLELTEKAEHAEKETRRRDRILTKETLALTRLNAASSRLWRTKSLQQGLDEMLDATIRLLDADKGHIQMFNANRDSLVITAHKGFRHELIEALQQIIPVDDVAFGRTLDLGERLFIADVEKEERFVPFRELARQAGFRALLATPLIAHDHTPLGMLTTHFRSPHRPSEQELRRLDLYVRQAADFIVRCRTDEALSKELSATRILQEVSAMMLGEGDVDEIYSSIARAASSLMGSKFASLQIFDEKQGMLRMLAWDGFGDEFAESLRTCAIAVNERRRVVAPDIESFEGIAGTPSCETYRKLGIRATQSTPLISRSGRLLGMITTHWSVPHLPNDRDFGMLDLLARQAADLIDRRQIGESLRESEKWRRQALDAADLGTWNLDTSTALFTSDERFNRIFGTPMEGLTMQEALGKIHLADRDRATRAVEAATRTDNPVPYEIEYRVVHSGGSTHWVLAKGSASAVETDEGPKLLSFAGTVADITERKKVEGALRESEELFRLVAESLPQKIFTAAPNGDLDYFNPQWVELTGFALEEIRGSGWTEFIHPDDKDLNLRAWQESLETGSPFMFEHRFRRIDGEYRWHITRAQPMKNDEGRIVMWVGSSTDVHEVRRADEEIRELLEDEVRKRTAELLATNEQLQGFTYSVAHDLRQQIRGISSNASILLSEAGDVLHEESLDTLGRLVDSSKRLAKLVDDLLVYARLGRQKPHVLPIDFTALVKEVAAFIVERGGCNLGVLFDVEPSLTTNGDAQLIRIVVENLLDNACKYSSETLRPHIEVGRLADAFFVRDNGIGFDMRFVQKLFEPFERLHHESAYTGTGIGLANVKRIVEKHGGKVWAEGSPGKGATFYFCLP